MPRKRSRITYVEHSSSDDSDMENQFKEKKPQKKVGGPPGRSKDKSASKNSRTKKQKNAVSWDSRKGRPQNFNIPAQSTSTSNPTIAGSSALALNKGNDSLTQFGSDRDYEAYDEGQSVDHSQAAKKKIDNFLKQFESDDEEDNDISTQAPSGAATSSVKAAAFYSLSDFEELDQSPSDKSLDNNSSCLPALSSKPSTSGLTTFVKDLNKPKEIPQESFAYVASLLTSSDESDLDEKPKEITLAELKKKTDEILKEVELSIEAMHPKPDPPPASKPSPPEIEAPSCPVCLEGYDAGLRQAMATLCGHIFCKTCITNIVKVSRKCPTCRKALDKKKYHPVYIF